MLPYGLTSPVDELLQEGGRCHRKPAVVIMAAVVVDVTHAIDTPGLESKHNCEAKLGGGPVPARRSVISPVVFGMLVAAAEAEGLP